MSGPDLLHVNGIELCVETFGSAHDPALLLLGGASASMDWWQSEFCERLAGGGRFVIRHDPRDTGESTSSPAGAPDYTADDMLADIVALLDALELERAHIVGVSMGGGMAQWVALEHPDRVATLTLISTSPGPDDDLPPMTDRLQKLFSDPPPPPDWSDRDAAVDYIVEEHRPYAGSLGFDEDGVRAIATTVVGRTHDLAAASNHWQLEGSGGPLRPRLGSIAVPTLVIHGTDDPMFPLGHGEALAREIPGARLVTIEGMGHEYPPRAVWDQVITELLRHTA
jgi:pimeloyl-ACP methyl ester carboxylesterase